MSSAPGLPTPGEAWRRGWGALAHPPKMKMCCHSFHNLFTEATVFTRLNLLKTFNSTHSTHSIQFIRSFKTSDQSDTLLVKQQRSSEIKPKLDVFRTSQHQQQQTTIKHSSQHKVRWIDYLPKVIGNGEPQQVSFSVW